MLNKAIIIAARAHEGQVDKAGAPYILHPLRVMLSLEDETERICGVLHDVIEDSFLTIEDLRREGFGEEVLLNNVGMLRCFMIECTALRYILKAYNIKSI